MKTFLFTILPKSLVSRAFGALASSNLPIWAPLFKNTFCKIYNLNQDEMEKPLAEYPNLQALFTRRLKAHSRPLAYDTIVCPVDGKISQCGTLEDQTLKMIQAKGRDYNLAGLLKDPKWATEYQGGTWATIYLAPFNYHRIHSPMTGKVTRVRHIPGYLWPVNEWSVANVSDLFCVNERIITELEGENGAKALVVKVGATNVGKISLSFLSWVSNQVGQFGVRDWTPDTNIPAQNIELAKGGELGCFELGSTVILILNKQAQADNLFVNQLGQAVSVGQSLA